MKLTAPKANRRDLRCVGRHRELPPLMAAYLEFEEFDDFAGDLANVACRIERDGMAAPERGMFGA